MWDSLSVKLALGAPFILAVALMGCGGNDDSVSPASLKGHLPPAYDLAGFKVERELGWDNPIDLVAQGLPLPESTPPSRAVEVFEDAGFEAGAGERLVVAKGNEFEGPEAGVAVVQLGSDDEARDALDYIRKEGLKQPCFAVCSVEGREFAVPGIPGAKGVHLTPLRQPPADAPPPFEAYGVGFTIGPRLYLTNSGGHPGQVNKSWVLAGAKALYERNAKSGGDEGEDEGGATDRDRPAAEGGEAILVKTRMNLPVGEVLPGSSIGDSAFCPGGRIRDRHGGTAGLGLVVKTLRCPNGRLTITFSPTQRSLIQSSSWRVVNGSGRFEGLHGHGRMKARFGIGARSRGRETFTGTVAR
jgi:hypothetical protein